MTTDSDDRDTLLDRRRAVVEVLAGLSGAIGA